MSWYTSWLPSLPSLNFAVLPASIQGSFVSFVLKRTLGHLFKPGQLDSPQIDSQIGSGYVQVNDLELDEVAVNGYFEGTPLVLETGSVQSVTARIPWPNPLTSSIGVSIKGLHLKFRVNKLAHRPHKSDKDISDSVASLAESFIHEELTDQEEARLWESIHSASRTEGEDNGVPGGLDPFMAGEEELQMDPAGVSYFATLIERLLARFQFDAQDIQITLTDSDNITLRFRLADIQYSTTGQEDDGSSGSKRTLTLKGVDVFTSNHVQFSIPNSPSTTRPFTPTRQNSSASLSHGSSPRSSSSSMDEEAEMNMSQSIAVFPPRPVSPANSTTSSIYHSFIEKSHPLKQDAKSLGVPASEAPLSTEELFLSFGSNPLSVRLTTPAPIDRASEQGTASSQENLKVDLQSGIVAVAIQPWQVLGIARLAETLAAVGITESSTTPDQKGIQAPSPFTSLSIDLGLDLRGICLLLSSSFGEEPDGLNQYFTHPIIPPSLTTGYTRIFVDTVSGRGAVSPNGITSNISVFDLSIFQHLPKSADGRVQAIPVLITDPYLPVQYDQTHSHPTHDNPFNNSLCPQPTLRVINWKDHKCSSFGNKLSSWRNRPQPGHSRNVSSNSTSQEPCISCFFDRSLSTRPKSTDNDQSIRLNVSPLHAFLDFESSRQSGGIICFLQDLLLEQSAYKYTHPEDFPTSGPPINPTASFILYDEVPASPNHHHPSHKPQRLADDGVRNTTTLTVAMLRVSILAPPPPGRKIRSGIFIVDLNDIVLSDTDVSSLHQQVRFDHAPHSVPQQSGNLAAHVQCRRIVVGCSPAFQDSTVALLSIGPLSDGSEQRGVSLPPVIKVIQPNRADSQDAKMMVNVDIPSIYISISKDQWDAVQYWIDDLTQALERINSPQDLAESRDSRSASLIGSRYFAKSQRGSTTDSSRSIEPGIKTALSINVTELYVRCNLPRNNPEEPEVRPFNVTGSDFNASVELHSNGKLAAVLSFMDACIQDTEPSGKSRTFLSLTAARSLTAPPRPLIKIRFISSVIPETTAKETKLSLSLCNFTFNAYPDIQWVSDLIAFSKAPPGTFEAVVPSERTCISVKIVDGSVRAFAPNHPGALILSIAGLHFVTDIIGDAEESSFRLDISSLAVLAIDDTRDAEQQRIRRGETESGMVYWKGLGYALLAEVSSTKLHYQENKESSPQKQILVDGAKLRIHACADTLASIGAFGGDLATMFKPSEEKEATASYDPQPAVLSPTTPDGSNLTGSIDEGAFRQVPEIGPTPDMIYDDLPTNLDYLDESFGAAAGLRELTDDDLDEFDIRDIATPSTPIAPLNTGVVSSVGGETIKMLSDKGINVIEDYYDHLPRETIDDHPTSENEALRVRVRNSDITLLLYDGYDWPRTRRTIEEEVKEMRKRLAKIRQFVASGQAQEPIPEDTSALLFNSVYIGLDQDVDATQPEALLAAIDDELRDDFETGSQSSWQTMQNPISAPRAPSVRVHGKKLTRARGPSMEFCLSGLNAELNQYGGNSVVVSRTFVTVRDLEILDHIKTSTWKKFLTALRSDSKGNIRETGANMVRIELHSVRPAPGHASEEARLRAKILPLRLYVDQDAVDFLKKFFSFKDPNVAPASEPTAPEQEAYIQMAEIFPIDLKLDYKPRRVDYRALREGKTIELMNFFHFDGAEMTLRHITMSGVTGWPKLFEMLNDLWTPDVKATQLVEVISGVAPIRSMVNVGSGVADLVLLPIAQYRKDGRIVRGVQKGATAFVKSTALEAIKMGARLATGTQVILEQAEGILGGDFENTITTETFQPSFGDDLGLAQDIEAFDDDEAISKYAQQPADITEGVQSAYKSLQRNLSSAAQTILAVPMEVYERSGNEGPVRSVIRAVPIAVLKPMIGATEAVSKTLLGLHNTLDPDVRHENEAKYKNR